MSLLSYSSPWTNDNQDTKKRNSTIRKTAKIRSYTEDDSDRDYTSFNTQSQSQSQPTEYKQQARYNQQPDVKDMTNLHAENNTRVNMLINQMSIANDGDKLANFTPPPRPITQTKKDMTVEPDEAIEPPKNPIQIPKPIFQNGGTTDFLVRDPSQSNYSNYQAVYDPTQNRRFPSQYNRPIESTSSTIDHRLMEKINYMIHMLENMENEKTANVTEEFILYTFLGVFIIFVVDSFSKGGKYVR
jgi:hypothetical protein